MDQEKPKIKRIPKKFQPKGLTVIYEDKDIVVVDKSPGLLTMSTPKEKERTAYFNITDYVKKGFSKSKNRVFIVHRLDRETSGLLVFAKSEKHKRFLQDNWHDFSKTYLALVDGKLEKQQDVIESYLLENKAHKMYSVGKNEKGKFAKTGYKVIRQTNNYSLLEIKLFTGRKNQIRAHLSEHGHPIVGDKVYGNPPKKIKRLCLHAATLTIQHPYSKKTMTFETEVPAYFEKLMR